MTEWVRTYLKYPTEHAAAVEALVLNEKGLVDFRVACPVRVPFPLESINAAAVAAAWKALEAAGSVLIDLDDMQATAIEMIEKADLKEQVYPHLENHWLVEQVTAMLGNMAATGHLHDYSLAKNCWSTKWNACRQAPVETRKPGLLYFDTPDFHPYEWIKTVSEKLPGVEIDVRYASYRLGSLAGFYRRVHGRMVAVIDPDISCDVSDGATSMIEAAAWNLFSRMTCGLIEGFDPDKFFELPEVNEELMSQFIEDRHAALLPSISYPSFRGDGLSVFYQTPTVGPSRRNLPAI